MRILILASGPDSSLNLPLQNLGHQIEVRSENNLTAQNVTGFDLLISYGFRFKILQLILDRFPRRAFNLHISLLPWNRGADPNLWSFLEDTPKGVSIHLLDAGLDTGEIVAQRPVQFLNLETQTLASTYSQLKNEIENLFFKIWPEIESGKFLTKPQAADIGSSHRLKEKAAFEQHWQQLGWQTPVSQLHGLAKLKAKAP